MCRRETVLERSIGSRRSLRPPFWALCVGSSACSCWLCIATPTRFRDSRGKTFRAAKQRWEQSAPANYNIEVQVTGRQPAVYFAAVRDGIAEVATRDGEVLSRRRTIDTWTVPGMFTTIHSDVVNLELHRDGKADRATPQLLIRGVFDEEHGAPMRYHRTELRQWGPNVEVMWEVKRFEIVEEQ